MSELFCSEQKVNLYSAAIEAAETNPQLKEVLDKEEIIHISTSKLNRKRQSMKVYAFTDHATIISFTHNYQSKKPSRDKFDRKALRSFT